MGDVLEKAGRYTRGGGTAMSAGELKALVRELQAKLEYGLARKVLSKAREDGFSDTWFLQQLALCTYKDEELVPLIRFREADRILDGILAAGTDSGDLAGLCETLSLKGAVYKRIWEYGGQLEDLHQALAFYIAAWERAVEPVPETGKEPIPPRDCGYSAVNAAFILDILDSRARRAVMRSSEKLHRFGQFEEDARRIREDALKRLTKAIELDAGLMAKDWLAQTMAELHFGLRNYGEAGDWLSKTNALKLSEWKTQTTFKQLVSIARLQGLLLPNTISSPEKWDAPWQALTQLLGAAQTARALSCYRGKVGLALSGGGFRASLFHLGVLARLAEMDVLRSVETLSTVSGGSIVGAHYYLEVQDLLQRKGDESITREDYITIVKRVQERFPAGVQRNLRMRALADLKVNLKMVSSTDYSRSHRMGELYEEALYSLIGEEDTPRASPHNMPELIISPADEPRDSRFNPKFSNWRREAKVPILILNATSLNTGHNWHFTARWMGEPPGRLETEIDINERYRRLWYTQAAGEAHQRYPLGYAVAASACVPGLFEPLVLEGLYPERTVRLVDGGVHDNQGVDSLLDEGCTLVLCSDACGQMADQAQPSNGLLGVPLRANSILMDRVREAQYQDLQARVESHALQGLFFIHLKRDLETLPVDWINCDDPTVHPPHSSSTTSYGVDKDLQRKLAAMRTDLDSFTEVEACSLMLSGYLMTEKRFRELNEQHQRENGANSTWGGYRIDAPREGWTFLQLEDLLRQPPASPDARRVDLGKQLEASSSLAFKIFKLNPYLKGLSWMVAGLLLLLVMGLVFQFWPSTFCISVGVIFTSLVMLAIGMWVPVMKWLQPEKAAKGYVNKALVAVLGYLVATVHLSHIDPLFIKRGKLKRLLQLR
jgi:predicted acylesterase/phospholipase RssA